MPNSSSETAALVQQILDGARMLERRATAFAGHHPDSQVLEAGATLLRRAADALTPRSNDHGCQSVVLQDVRPAGSRDAAPSADERTVPVPDASHPAPPDTHCRLASSSESPSTPRTQEPPSGKLTLLEWAQERFANSERIAAGTTGDDRDGWLEDVAYWRGIVTHLQRWAEVNACLPPLTGAASEGISAVEYIKLLEGDRQRLTEERDEWESKAKALTQALINERLRKGFGS